MRTLRALMLLTLGAAAGLWAQREPVLKQIDHPHNYYFREMYLPQLTSGPSAVAWSPGGREVVFSMKGSLWRQRVDSSEAAQLTAGPGYDYMPDWSPDGRYIAYSKYAADALELYVLEVQTGASWPITSEGAVNLEAHWSPDGSRLAYVSTSYRGHFHIFVAGMKDGRVQTSVRLTGETTTEAKRYYYSQVDHEISPTWSADGREILFVSNHGRIYGTGGLWRMVAEPGASPRPVLEEETTWRARPHWSPDGKRVAYSSYDRRQWHQIWLTTPEGGAPLPLTFGEYDNTAVRWSPDGKRIAFITNRSGNTELWTVETVGGAQRRLEQATLKYLHPMGRLVLTVAEADGGPAGARVFLRGSDGRAYAPEGAWMHADDGFVRGERKDEPRYFHLQGRAEITLPPGPAEVIVVRGLAYRMQTRSVQVEAGKSVRITIRPQRLPALPGVGRWVSHDLHVHMNYAGTYRNTPERMVAQARAEDLNIVSNLIVNKEQRVPDIAYFTPKPDAASTADTVLTHGQEFHTSHWGHLGLLGLNDHFLMPDFSTYAGTAMASPYPSNTAVADLAHRQGALVGYVHPYEIEDMPDPSAARNHALPVDAALGKVDYVEVVGFSDHRMTADIWYRLLNLGFRLPAGGGTDAMADYASLRGPVGTNRTYALLPAGRVDAGRFLAELKAGRTFATNAPLLYLEMGGKTSGATLRLPRGGGEVPFYAALRTYTPIEHLELVCNGQVAQDLTATMKTDMADVRGRLRIAQSGWCLLRGWSEKPAFPVLDIYPYGTTSPVYVEVAGAPQRAPEDAEYFLGWIDRLYERTRDDPDFNSAEERETVLKSLREARAVYAKKAER
jgi:TolB protein